MVQWLAVNWVEVVVPFLILCATYAVGLWLINLLTRDFDRRVKKAEWQGGFSRLVIKSVRRPFLFCFFLLGVLIAVEASILPEFVKETSGKVISSLFVLFLSWFVISISQELLELYLPKIKVPLTTVDLAVTSVIITFLVAAVLVDLAIWGVPTTPFLLIIAAASLVGLMASRNAAPNAFAALHIWNAEIVKAGDYIKLETGEEGFVTEINWHSTHMKTRNATHVIIPNSRLIQSKFVNFGQTDNMTSEFFSVTGRSGYNEFPVFKPGEPAVAADGGEAGGRLEPDEKSVLSDREKEIARLISEGVSNKEIADKLFISENTVKVHVKNILKKLELRNRQQLAAFTAVQNWTTAGEGRKPEKYR